MIRICLVCKKYSAKPADQLSGQLPRDRITQSPPFQSVGIDFTDSSFVTDDFVNRNLECVSILLSSIWDSDFHGFGNLGLKRGRDFRGGDPMAVQEALAMERSLIGGWQ
ncbi:hypothetical protein TNCV_928581 [Trichonephila clavipes]|nr:hypothetical protein TNCV_928581 [Trichonephila clavipes]